MVMLPCSVACAPMPSVTFTTNVNVPAEVGVPEMEAGGDGARRRPGGRWPEAIDHVYGATPPERKKFCKYAAPTVPSGQQDVGKVITSGGTGLIVRVKACCAVSPAPSRTCSVNVLVW